MKNKTALRYLSQSRRADSPTFLKYGANANPNFNGLKTGCKTGGICRQQTIFQNETKVVIIVLQKGKYIQ